MTEHQGVYYVGNVNDVVANSAAIIMRHQQNQKIALPIHTYYIYNICRAVCANATQMYVWQQRSRAGGEWMGMSSFNIKRIYETFSLF